MVVSHPPKPTIREHVGELPMILDRAVSHRELKKKMMNIKVLSYNARSLLQPARQKHIRDLFQEMEVNIVFIQEAKTDGPDEKDLGYWIVLSSGVSRGKRNSRKGDVKFG